MNRSQAWRRWLKIYFVTNLILAPVLFCGAAASAAYSEWFIHHAARAEGVIVGFDEAKLEDQTTQSASSVTYSPIFKFVLSDGSEHVVHASSGSNPPGFTAGEHVPVLFVPSDPQGAKIESFGQVWGLALGFGIAAVVTLTIGTIGRIVILRRKEFANLSLLPR